MEFTNKNKYTRLSRFGEAVLGYESVFDDPARCLDYVSYLQDQEFNVQATLQFAEPDSNDPRANPSKPDDEDYRQKMASHKWFLRLQEAWRECGLVKKNFGTVVSCVSQLPGEDLFSYLSARQYDLTLRSKYLYRFDDGQVAYDCSLGENFVGPMIPFVIKKIITYWDAMPASEREFQSEFAKKAWADLLAYAEVKAANEANLADLLERPVRRLRRGRAHGFAPRSKVEDLEPENVPLKVKVVSVLMETESTDPAQLDVEGGSMEPESPNPDGRLRCSSSFARGGARFYGIGSFKDLGGDSDDFKNLPKINDEDVKAALKKQGVWGDQMYSC